MTTPILQLGEWEEAQGQPYVTVNVTLRWLECFAQLSVISQTETAPPVSPADGDSYIIGGSATGDWAGRDSEIALFLSTAWVFRAAPIGSIAWVQDDDAHYKFVAGSPSSWTPL